MANSRSINNTLDSTQVNGSANIFWSANYINELLFIVNDRS